MPRRASKRRWRGPSLPVGEVPALDPAVLGFLIDGDHRRAMDDLLGRGRTHAAAAVVWRHAELAVLWRAHRGTIRREAERRGVEAFGDIYERYREGGFVPLAARHCEPYEPAADDPRLLMRVQEERTA